IFTISTKVAPPYTIRMNLAVDKPVTASSSQSGNEVERINDGKLNTRWAAANNTLPQSFTIDLMDVYKTDSTEMVPYGDRDYQYLIEGSTDGTNFFTLSDQRSNILSGNSLPASFEVASVRYVRVTFSGAAT